MKKQFSFFVSVVIVAFVCYVFTTCKKDAIVEPQTSEVAFNINTSAVNKAPFAKTPQQSEINEGYSLGDVKKIVITIQTSDGGATKYTASEINIQKMNGVFYSQKIVLKTGSYRLTEFDLIDSDGNTIFAAPLEGSLEAQNVTYPLPISFNVVKNVTTPVNVEVLSTEGHIPEDFGLSRFPIFEVKTFSIAIGVADKGSDNVLSAKLTVSNGSYLYEQDLDSILNNIVTVKDSLSNYSLTIERSGYKTYTHTFPIDSLKMFEVSNRNLPLLIELEKQNLNFTDDFEVDSLNNYWTVYYNVGRAIISSEQSHSGLYSLKLTAVEGSVSDIYVSHTYSAPMKGRISVWMFDTFAGQYGPYSKLNCYNTLMPSGYGNVFAIGVDDWKTDKYTTGSDIPNAGNITEINRTVAWHKMEIYFNASQVEFYLDNTLVNTVYGDYSFNKVELFTGYHSGSFYFDDFDVNIQ